MSCEFNLLYRFHSAVSKRDEKWTENFYRELFPVTDPHNVSLQQLAEGLAIFEKSVSDKKPHERVFGGLKRQADGTFNDADLVKILKESIEDPAGAFGANNVPDILKQVEVLGIQQARKWQVATLNEFRKFFGLQAHKTFSDINPDPYVADTLQKLYDHPDLVELYVCLPLCRVAIAVLVIDRTNLHIARPLLGGYQAPNGSGNGALYDLHYPLSSYPRNIHHGLI